MSIAGRASTIGLWSLLLLRCARGCLAESSNAFLALQRPTPTCTNSQSSSRDRTPGGQPRLPVGSRSHFALGGAPQEGGQDRDAEVGAEVRFISCSKLGYDPNAEGSRTGGR